MSVKKVGVQVGLVGALAFTALGVGAGVANAEVPSAPGMTWKLDKWDDRHDWDDRRGPRWNGPAYWNGPHYGGPCAWVPPAVSMWVPPAAC